MACTHPFGVESIQDIHGKVIGVRCPTCGMRAFKGESFWAQIKREVLPRIFGRCP